MYLCLRTTSLYAIFNIFGFVLNRNHSLTDIGIEKIYLCDIIIVCR